MKTDEIQKLISIGFGRKSDYKPSWWRKAEKIMNWLCDNTDEVFRVDYGRGKGKYSCKGDLWENAPKWAELYAASL